MTKKNNDDRRGYTSVASLDNDDKHGGGDNDATSPNNNSYNYTDYISSRDSYISSSFDGVDDVSATLPRSNKKDPPASKVITGIGGGAVVELSSLFRSESSDTRSSTGGGGDDNNNDTYNESLVLKGKKQEDKEHPNKKTTMAASASEATLATSNNRRGSGAMSWGSFIMRKGNESNNDATTLSSFSYKHLGSIQEEGSSDEEDEDPVRCRLFVIIFIVDFLSHPFSCYCNLCCALFGFYPKSIQINNIHTYS